MQCSICADTATVYATGLCNHPICHTCSLRMRLLYNNKDCSICKTTLPLVILSSVLNPYESYDTSLLLTDLTIKDVVFETKQIRDQANQLLKHTCSECSTTLKNWSQLKFHAKKEHKKFVCDICIAHKKVFPTETVLFTSAELNQHKKNGAGDPSFKGHPECQFCTTFFYSSDELYEHCRDSHEHCFLCKRMNILNQYFRNYDSLVEHFADEHFPCSEQECVEKKFVVFSSDIDLEAHCVTIFNRFRSIKREREG